RVLGPSWTQAERVLLYANGTVVREFDVSHEAGSRSPGVKWEQTWTLTRPVHDVHLVVIALGPGVEQSFWKTAKPYQPMSPVWKPYVIGCSGAVWIDADGDGRATPAREYADDAVDASG